MNPGRYVGRFAPSPTGLLHLGSLLTAVASFISARQHGGKWLVRMEDIDPPREAPGGASAILRALERYELHWDGPVLYQSTRVQTYRAAAERLLTEHRAYRCDCTRSKLRELSKGSPVPDRYPGICREKNLGAEQTAIRLRAPLEPIGFEDTVQGSCLCSIDAVTGDYIVFRRDGLPSYHLAVVIDDAWQGITDVVRGADLLDSTPLHIHLQHTLDLPTPRYSHLPVLVNAQGQKLSKQTGAAPVALEHVEEVAFDVLRYLDLEPPLDLHGAQPGELWSWAAQRWDISRLAGRQKLAEIHRNVAADSAID